MEPYANATETRHPEGMDEEKRGSFLNQRVMLKLHLHQRYILSLKIHRNQGQGHSREVRGSVPEVLGEAQVAAYAPKGECL